MWVVKLPVGRDLHCIYGPFTEEVRAERFARYIADTVPDYLPPVVEPLRSPVDDLLDHIERNKPSGGEG